MRYLKTFESFNTELSPINEGKECDCCDENGKCKCGEDCKCGPNCECGCNSVNESDDKGVYMADEEEMAEMQEDGTLDGEEDSEDEESNIVVD